MIAPHALITGAGQRIGRAIALDLAREGWKISVHYRKSRKEADALVAEINEGGPSRAVALAANLEKETEVETLVPRAVAALGPLTALINNASVFENDGVDTMTRSSWDRHVETNLRAPLVLAQDFAKQLPPQAEGAIVNILDQRVWRLTPKFFSYTLTKAALWTATQTMAQALGPRIRVNGVGPGPTLRNPRQSEADFARQTGATVLGKGASAEDVAAAVRYLLGATAVTGQMIAVDGGQHLSWRTPDVEGVPE